MERNAGSAVGAIHLWIEALPCLTQISHCPRCVALVLTADLPEHAAWHRRQGHTS